MHEQEDKQPSSNQGSKRKHTCFKLGAIWAHHPLHEHANRAIPRRLQTLTFAFDFRQLLLQLAAGLAWMHIHLSHMDNSTISFNSELLGA